MFQNHYGWIETLSEWDVEKLQQDLFQNHYGWIKTKR